MAEFSFEIEENSWFCLRMTSGLTKELNRVRALMAPAKYDIILNMESRPQDARDNFSSNEESQVLVDVPSKN